MQTVLRRLSLLFVLTLSATNIRASTLPKGWSAAIVSIEVPPTDQELAAHAGSYRQVGTGFFVSPDEKPPFRAILITAKHVFESACANWPTVYMRFENATSNPTGQPQRFPLQICDRKTQDDKVVSVPKWISHPTVDLAGIIPPPIAPGQTLPSVTVFKSETIAGPEEIKKWEISEGDEVFTISFTPNLVQGRPSSTTVRGGVIANFSEEQDSFIADSFVFPGNSGSPVVLKPTAVHLLNNNVTIGRVNPALLLGVVVEYVPYIDVALSVQTNRPRVSFEENSGLTRVIRGERVKELLQIMAPMLPPNP